MNSTRELVAAIDLGSARTRGVVGRFTPDGRLEVVAYRETITQGLRNGVVANIDEAAASIRTVVAALDKALNLKIRKVYAGISGLKIYNRQASGYRMTEQGMVTQEHINSLVKEVQRYAVKSGEKLYHLVPEGFTVDNERGITQPVGMAGQRVDGSFRVISAADVYEQNLKRCVEKAGLTLAGAFVNPYVQGAGFLTKDEKEAGVVLLDMGAGTTEISLYYENKLCLATVLPFGGNVITNDIREGCNILPRHAEMLKIQCGYAFSELAPDNKVAQIPEVEGWQAKEISFRNLSGIIQARLEEILEGVNFQLESTGLTRKLGAGIVLTGGGSQMRGIDQLVSFMTGLEVRYGKPVVPLREQLFNDQIMNGHSATMLGLLINGLTQARKMNFPAGMIVSDVVESSRPSTAERQPAPGLKNKMAELFGRAKDSLNGLMDEDEEMK